MEDGQEVDNIPSKPMSKGVIVDLVNDLLAKEN